MNYIDIKKVFEESLRELNTNLISEHPEILKCYEPQINFELARILYTNISKEWLRWKDFRFYFDTKSALQVSGTIDWCMNFDWRPDIIIKPTNNSLHGLVIEVKIIRDLKPDVDEEFGICKYHESVNIQIERFQADKEKLQTIVDINNGNSFKAVSLAFYLNENKKEPGSDWTVINPQSKQLKCYYQVAYFENATIDQEYI